MARKEGRKVKEERREGRKINKEGRGKESAGQFHNFSLKSQMPADVERLEVTQTMDFRTLT